MPGSFPEKGIYEDAFIGKLDDLAMRSYEDQCAPPTPRMPMLDDMKDLMTAAYYGTSLQDVRSRHRRGRTQRRPPRRRHPCPDPLGGSARSRERTSHTPGIPTTVGVPGRSWC